jgi:Na+/proline symporter
MDDLVSLIVLGVLGVVIVVVVIWVYFLPTIVARKRKHNDESAIFVLNLLAGFTILFWIVALVWANNDNTKKQGGSSG